VSVACRWQLRGPAGRNHWARDLYWGEMRGVVITSWLNGVNALNSLNPTRSGSKYGQLDEIVFPL
jgi:hypothetical protein